jgi:hypothetical protein
MRRVSAPCMGSMLALSLCLTGCVEDDAVTKAISSYQTSSNTLTTIFQGFLTNANAIASEKYIDAQASNAAQIDSAGLAQSAVLTPDEIKLRASAIAALTAYDTALVSLASGKDTAKVQTECTAANKSLTTLQTDSNKALANPTLKSMTTKYGGPVSDAVTAMQAVLKLILDHRSIEAARKSVAENDQHLTPLYTLIETESESLYLLQKSQVQASYSNEIEAYNVARLAKPVNQADLYELTDRIEQSQVQLAVLPGANPAKAVTDFQRAHVALVAAIQQRKPDKLTIATLIGEVKSLEAEVAPLAQSTATVAATK